MRKTAIFVFISCVFSTYGITINFTYDNAGNRIKRTIPRGNLPNQTDPEEYSLLSLTGSDIYVYPNPTDGPLNVYIPSFTNEDGIVVYVFNMSGQLVLEKKVDDRIVTLNLAAQPSGVYLVRIKPETGENIWKIVKK